MPRVCTLCNHHSRIALDGEIVAGNSYREIASRFGTSTAAVGRHRAHLAAAIVAADQVTGLHTAADIQNRLAELQARVERLVVKLLSGKDHRASIAVLREAREGLKTLHEVLVSSTIDRRLRALEEGSAGDEDTCV